MKYCLYAMVAFLVMINVALGFVGDVGDSDVYIQPDQSLSGTALEDTDYQSPGIETETGYMDVYLPYQGSSSSQGSYQDSYQQSQSQDAYPAQSLQTYVSPQGSGPSYQAPQISGPVQEQLTAEMLRLSPPQAESYVPDESLNFVSSSLPEKIAGGAYGQYGQADTASAGSSTWYYPGSVDSANRFYVQTASGLATVAGCSYGGYLPLWADIKSSGNFFVYEWYPGESTPSVRSWGRTGTGYKKGWFSGDLPGWHILCYNCGIWSNYIYIYVYPNVQAPSTSGYPINQGTMTQALPSSGYPIYQGATAQASLPDPNAERLVLPDFNMYRPVTGQAEDGSHHDYSTGKSSSPVAVAMYPAQTGYPGLANSQASIGHPLQANNPAIVNAPALGKIPAATSSSTKTCTTCTSSTVVTEGVYGNCPYEDEGDCYEKTSSESLAGPSGYSPKSYRAVYPKPSTCKCNEYYVLPCQGKVNTVAGVYCDEWLPLWSKISQSGSYWSYEWTVCTSPQSKGCAPDAKNFGYKKAGWYQTWFKGNVPGWHILSYHCKDWSNYIYIYVWPAD